METKIEQVIDLLKLELDKLTLKELYENELLIGKITKLSLTLNDFLSMLNKKTRPLIIGENRTIRITSSHEDMIIDFLKNVNGGVTRKCIVKTLDINGNDSILFQNLEKKGLIIKTGRGIAGDPYRYYLNKDTFNNGTKNL